MKKTIIAVAIASALASPAFAASFVNGGFEDGNINGWVAGGGNANISSRTGVNNTNINAADWLPGGAHYNAANSNSALISAGTVDPTQGALLGSTVFDGKYSYRVENTSNGGYASAIGQTVANYTDANIYFAWKAVLDGAHSASDAATIQITLRDVDLGTNIISRIYNAASGGGGVDARFAFNASLGDYYTPSWQIEQLAVPAASAGHTLSLSVLAADCQQTGHYGYVYLDGFGARIPDPNPTPEPASLALLGLGLAGLAASRRRKVA